MGSLNTAAGRLGRGDSAMLSRPTRGSVSSHDPPSSSSMLTITVAGGAVITQPRRPGSVVSDGASEGRGGGAGAVVKPLDDLTVAPVAPSVVFTWGRGDDGQLGLGNLFQQAVPSRVPGFPIPYVVAAGASCLPAVKGLQGCHVPPPCC